MDASNYDDFFSTTANWRVAGGALTDSISFESSFSTTIANHESEDGTIPAAVDHVAKSSLLLLTPFPNGEPCEITITFAQEHELRQVYIRSTARVYEVYYTKKLRHDKEYMCTVRCGIAMRGEEVHHISLTDSAASKIGVELMDKRIKYNGNGRTNDDDWVQVKAGDASLLNNDKDLLSIPESRKQDFFEATAEINDAEPCISITFRLLSLQDKGCALVDEVYVFADPIDRSESEQEEASGTVNPSGSSLLAMFMPTLLQLSRGKDVRKDRDGQLSDNSNSTNLGTLENPKDSGEIGNEIHKDINFIKADHRGVNSPVLVDNVAKHVDTQVFGVEIKPDTPCSNVETILHQLVNKVSWIETTLTRFEDQMLKPISRIDARLQLVEKKLEELGKKSFESELLVETKIPNPDALGCNTDKPPPESNELVGLTKNTDNPQLTSCNKTVLPHSPSIDNREDYAVLLPNSNEEVVEPGDEDNLISANEMISAESETEISNEEVGHSFGRGAFEKNPRRSLSINDALASALAGLLSSTSITDLVVKAPDFSNEDEMERKPPTDTHPEKSQVAAEDLGNTCSASESPTSSQKEPRITQCIEDDVQERLGDGVGIDDNAEKVVNVRNNDLDEETATSSTKADPYTERENLSDEPRNPDSLVYELKIPNVTIGCGSSRFTTAKECKGESEMDNVLKSVVGFQPTTSVDFLSPVLDVKFISEKEVSENKCFFEAFFTAEPETVVDCNFEAFDDNLVSVEDEELKDPPADTLSSVEMDHYESDELHLQLIADISTSSLI